MNSKFCRECGNKLDINAEFCPKCGTKCGTKQSNNTSSSTPQVNSNMICPKCGSTNVNVQVVNETQLVTKHHGIFWWIIIGWWWIFVKWLILTIPALLAAIFIGKRKKVKNTTKKIKVCQSCGHTW